MAGAIGKFLNKIKRRGIFFSNFLTLMLLSVIVIILFVVIIIPREKTAFLNIMESQAKNIVTSIAQANATAFLNGDYGSVVEHNMQILLKGHDIHYVIAVRHNGYSIVNTPGTWETREKPDPQWQGRELSTTGGIIESSIAGKKVYHYGAPLQFYGMDWGYIYIGLSLDNYNKQVRETYLVIFYLSALCLVIAFVLSYFFARRLTQPIRSLRHTAQMIMAGDLTARADIPPDDEVGELATSFNQMTNQMIAGQKKIQDAYDELEVYRKNLEGLVQQRTRELTAANQRLQHELTDRVKAEDALGESEWRYRVIFETAGNAYMIVETDKTISMINSAFEKLSGYSKNEVEGKKMWLDFFTIDDQKKLERLHTRREAAMGSDLEDYEATFIDQKGDKRFAYLTIATIPGTGQAMISLVDLTDIKKLEAQLLQSQKMEAIGQLAGGVAHDFNNILTAIIGYASLLKMNVKTEKALVAYVDPILSAAEKAAQLTQGLLAFSRKQIIEPKHVDVNDIVRRLEHLLVRLLGEDIELRITCDHKPITIFADVGQLEQILINLSTNARDAMPEGGLISITTEITDFKADDANIHKPYKKQPGRYALVTFSDTGSGMRQETIDHIFEPFYTTKEVGKGTGLGLSIVYGVIKQHNGYIDVDSEPGSGTTFRIYFPLVKATIEETHTEPPKPKMGHETILVAEDDDATRELSRIVLEKFGYTVIEAADGDDALTKFRMHQDHVDMILLDVIMPKQNGKAVYDAVLKIRPGMKALFVSGYTADIIHKKGIFESNIHFLSKPVRPENLARKIREILDAD